MSFLVVRMSPLDPCSTTLRTELEHKERPSFCCVLSYSAINCSHCNLWYGSCNTHHGPVGLFSSESCLLVQKELRYRSWQIGKMWLLNRISIEVITWSAAVAFGNCKGRSGSGSRASTRSLHSGFGCGGSLEHLSRSTRKLLAWLRYIDSFFKSRPQQLVCD